MVNFYFKRKIKLKKQLKKLQIQFIMNPGIFGTQTYSQSVAYSEPCNIQKFEGIKINF